MKRILTLILFISFSTISQTVKKYSDLNYIYEITFDNDKSIECNLKSIIIKNMFDNSIKQEINTSNIISNCSITYKENFILEDMNFDGYNDFRILKNKDIRVGLYYYWIFNPTTNEFEMSKIFDLLKAEPSFDKKKKRITTFSQYSCGRGYATWTNIYKFENNQLYLFKEKSTYKKRGWF